MTHVTLDGSKTQKNETGKMHGVTTLVSSLSKSLC